ncbi:hypothetical protein GE21DRAFT_1255521 [Neurospora crassa]|nr:hypothetical protein GE21DRAFT_1255521 [Neurospora crassa]
MVTQSRMEGPWKHFGNIGVRSLPDTYHLPRLLPRLCPSPHSPATAVPLDLMVLHKFDMRYAYVPQVGVEYTTTVPTLINCNLSKQKTPFPSRGFWSPLFHLAAITLSPMPGLTLDLARLDTSTTDFNISPIHPIHPSARGRYNIKMVRFSVMVPCY